MTKIPKVSPSTLTELLTNMLTLRTKLEQIEYLSVVILDLKDENARWVTYGEEYEKNRANCDELIQEMTVFATNKILILGGRPIKWTEYPIVSSIGQFNEVKGSFKDDGKLLEWVKWLLSNIEHQVRKSSTFIERKFNDRVLRQLFLDSKDKGEEYQKFNKRWGDAQRLEDDFEDYLVRQLKILSLGMPITKKENHELSSSVEEVSSGSYKPHTLFIAHEKQSGEKRGNAWNKLKLLASESKGENQVELSGYGKLYLKRDREKPEAVVIYNHSKFESPSDGKLVTKGAFDQAWTTDKSSKKKGNV
jgi:hypothetical protein